MHSAPPVLLVEPIVRAALLEDIGRGGDLTTEAIVPLQQRARAAIAARANGVVAGISIAALTFQLLDATAEVTQHVQDGETIEAGQTIATIACNARALLTGERTALNFLSHLSGIATATRRLVDLAQQAGNARIVCTRKTTPGLRVLEKFAVRCGGGSNHRFGLDDGVLIKDNHLAIAGSLTAAVQAARSRAGHMVVVEVEVDTLEQLQEAVASGADAVLLDNMSPALLERAVAMVAGTLTTEASGNISPATVGTVAATGVDLISSGWVTHSAPALDLGLDVETG